MSDSSASSFPAAGPGAGVERDVSRRRLTSEKACTKGLRHAYGVNVALNNILESRIKKWLGHESLETTEIYLDVTGPEDHAIAERMWGT